MDNSTITIDKIKNEELLTQLKEWAAGGEDQLVPELLVASTNYSGIIEDDLIYQLLERLYEVENKPRIWLQFAFSILSVYKKASNYEIKLKFLSYIYNFNEKIAISWKTNCNPTIKGAGNFFRAELPAEIKKLKKNNV